MKAKIIRSLNKTQNDLANSRNEKVEQVVCDKCKAKFCLNSININEKAIKINNKSITLVYFCCPSCNEIYKMFIKDAVHEMLCKDLNRAKKKLVAARQKGEDKKRIASLMNMVIKKADRVSKHVTRLNEEFSGIFTFAVDENGNKDLNNIIYITEDKCSELEGEK